MKIAAPKLKMPGRVTIAVILMNIVLILLIGYEAWFLKGLYSSLVGKFENEPALRVSRINLDYYHKALDKYTAAQSFAPAPASVNNPFKAVPK